MMDNQPVYIIAEIGVNHNGDMDLARQLIKEAARIGADAVKFQSFNPDLIVHPKASSAKYQEENCGAKSQYELLQNLSMTSEQVRQLKAYSDSESIDFISTPFDLENLHILLELDVPYIKVSSGDLTFAPLLLRMAQSQKNIILSTGMATIQEIEEALELIAFGMLHTSTIPNHTQDIHEACKHVHLQDLLKDKVVLCHCTTAYPASKEELNLNVLDDFKGRFELPIGYSDHSLGWLASIAAVSKGAQVIEKHITLDNAMDGPDHKASLDINDFAKMVEQIRQVEMMLGTSDKAPTPSEQENKPIVRRGVYASRPIPEGKIIEEEDLLCLRPALKELTPMQVWNMIGEKANKEFQTLEAMDE